MPKKGFESIGDILKRLTKRLGIEKKISEQTLFLIWDEVVGKEISRHAKPSSVYGGKLLVNVENSAYIQEYSFLKKDLKNKLNERLGKSLVREIMFRVGQI